LDLLSPHARRPRPRRSPLPPCLPSLCCWLALPMSDIPYRPSRQRFYQDLSHCLFDFVVQLLPTPEELAVKEDVRKLLERLIRTIEPQSRLLSFGSTANGFSLRNSGMSSPSIFAMIVCIERGSWGTSSVNLHMRNIHSCVLLLHFYPPPIRYKRPPDMDLCCLIDSEERLSASDLVTMLGDLLERETKFTVKPLPHARIPIVKLSLAPSPGLPLGIACDIGFENRLALENTRLLMCYAMIDPTRVRTMVLFRKCSNQLPHLHRRFVQGAG
jgi:terminal uridylyltransferase